jgi:hypothetical protein
VPAPSPRRRRCAFRGAVEDVEELTLAVRFPALPVGVVRAMGAVGLDRLDQLVHPAIVMGLGHQDRHLPRGIGAKLQHGLQLRLHAHGAFAVGFVHHEDVRDLEQPGFHHLHRISGLRHQDDDDGLRELHDVELGLSDADGLDDDSILPEGVEEMGHLPGGAGEPAASATRAQAADEDGRVEGMILHANAVAEDGPAAERARGIDRHDPDALGARAELPDQAVDQRRLAGARRSGDAERVGVAEPRVDACHDRRHVSGFVLDPRHQLGEGDAVARQHPIDERELGRAQRTASSTAGRSTHPTSRRPKRRAQARSAAGKRSTTRTAASSAWRLVAARPRMPHGAMRS